jgi:hypothetical protein
MLDDAFLQQWQSFVPALAARKLGQTRTPVVESGGTARIELVGAAEVHAGGEVPVEGFNFSPALACREQFVCSTWCLLGNSDKTISR